MALFKCLYTTFAALKYTLVSRGGGDYIEHGLELDNENTILLIIHVGVGSCITGSISSRGYCFFLFQQLHWT